MNQIINDNMGLIIVLFMLAIVFLFLGVILIAFILLKRNKASSVEENKKPDYEKIKRELATQATSSTGHCYVHKDISSSATCAICEQEICEKCVRQIDNINFCSEHVTTYISNTWSPITNQKTTPDNPTDGIYIYNFKKDIWVSEEIPCYIVTDYKINMETDQIESFVQLNVRDEDVTKLKDRIEKAK